MAGVESGSCQRDFAEKGQRESGSRGNGFKQTHRLRKPGMSADLLVHARLVGFDFLSRL